MGHGHKPLCGSPAIAFQDRLSGPNWGDDLQSARHSESTGTPQRLKPRLSLHFFTAVILLVFRVPWLVSYQTPQMLPAQTSDVSDDPDFASYQRVTNGIAPPKATHAPDPQYPQLPVDAEPRGVVVMLVGVDAHGHVGPVRVIRSTEKAFDTTAVDTVKKWKFKPARKDGQAVPVQITVEMKFER